MVRSKYRYVTVKINLTSKRKELSDVNFKTNDLYTSILSKVQKLHGDFGLSVIKTGFMCKYCNQMTGTAILKIRHGPHRYVTTVLPFISDLGKESVQIQMMRITATLHQAYKYLKVYQQTQLEQIWNQIPEENREEMKGKYGNLEVIEKLLVTEKLVHVKQT